jgi:hypothetical protein
MALIQIDVIKRVVFPDTASGFYYWTSVYYALESSWSNLLQAALAVNQLDKNLCTADVNQRGLRIKRPPGRGNVVLAQNYSINQPGSLPSEGEFHLINVCRWWLFDSAGNRSWRLNRMPLRPSDIDGDQLSATGLTRQQTSMSTFISQSWTRNSHGNKITSGQVVQGLSMWQLRHGTKRRNRTVWP